MINICIIPNHGARIGHQVTEHFFILTYCLKYKFNFIYHPFIKNSANFENILNFGKNYTCYKDLDLSNYIIINLNDIIDDFHYKCIEYKNDSERNYLVYGGVIENLRIMNIINSYITRNSVTDVKKKYRELYSGSFPKYFNFDYICIHIRCGDIKDDKNRYIQPEYFINTYKKLIEKYEYLKDLHIIIVTENNFTFEEFILNNIKNAIIIKTDPIKSFNIMCNSKYLITSKSGFSNLAYILNDIKVIVHPQDWNIYYDNKLILN